MWVLDNWVAMSLTSAAAWAMSCVIDVGFVSNGVYRKASDGPAIAGLFFVFPAIATSGSVNFASVNWELLCVGWLSGCALLLHVYFYFRALFQLNDAVNVEIFSNLDILIIPVLAFFVLGERLPPSNYLAIALTALGVIVLIFYQISRFSPAIVANLAAAVICISVMIVMQAWLLKQTNFATATWLFSTSAFLTTLCIFGLPKRPRRRIGNMFRQFGALFVVVQLLEVAAVLSTQRATEKGPSVSLVALLECTMPIFIMAFSIIVVWVTKYWMPTQSAALRSALSLQTVAAPSKLVSMVLIAGAIVLSQG